jgi:hypothetical protein
MRLSIIKLGKEDTIFYNLGIFSEEEEIIIFPSPEFLKFYEKITKHIKAVNNIIKKTQTCPPSYSSPQALEHIENFVKQINHDMELLIKFEVQTTLESFKNKHLKQSETQKQKIEKNLIFEREKLQCLIGL